MFRLRKLILEHKDIKSMTRRRMKTKRRSTASSSSIAACCWCAQLRSFSSPSELEISRFEWPWFVEHRLQFLYAICFSRWSTLSHSAVLSMSQSNQRCDRGKLQLSALDQRYICNPLSKPKVTVADSVPFYLLTFLTAPSTLCSLKPAGCFGSAPPAILGSDDKKRSLLLQVPKRAKMVVDGTETPKNRRKL